MERKISELTVSEFLELFNFKKAVTSNKNALLNEKIIAIFNENITHSNELVKVVDVYKECRSIINDNISDYHISLLLKKCGFTSKLYRKNRDVF